ncbi:hypothetical protein [Vibrio chagasii]|uniref:hypothetical protein n=1 Tax=Vibrio chagasii TaxID=170679 RepID=UPI0022839A50|nr:hypothetical protein [Vibrio chagasii]MCY9829335.1 hypothetical protein [Vibrio chagasii]
MSFYRSGNLIINVSMIVSIQCVILNDDGQYLPPEYNNLYGDFPSLCKIVLSNGEVIFTEEHHYYRLEKVMFTKS